jgi:PAS domain S-box-containing protein
MRLLAALIALVIPLAGLYVLFTYFVRLRVLAEMNMGQALGYADQAITTTLWAGSAAAIFGALFLYTVLTTRVTARRLAEKMTRDLAVSRAQFERFYELSPVPYLLIDRTGVIHQPNKAAQRFWQKKVGIVKGENIFDRLHSPEEEKPLVAVDERVRRGVPVEHEEMQFSFDSGEVRWVLVSIERLDVRGTKRPLALATLVDIHEQKELERIKTEFLSLASHQLRTPLANLKWQIDFLLTRKKEELTDTVRGYLEKMFRRNEDMIDLVNTLLNLSRIEMGRVKVEKEEVDIMETIRGVIEELTPQAESKHMTLVRELPEQHSIYTDKRLVRIIVQNLLANAIRYTTEGGTATLSLKSNGGATIVSVADTGVGIPPEEQGKIFSKMYRATNAQKMEANGNGIGLYMCKALAEAMGGTITFESEMGKGTTFTVTLPNR